MGVPTKFYTWVDSQAAAGLFTAARLNGDFDPLYACLDPATGGLEDTNVKAGAKIVCTDRAHTVTGVWTFTTAPVLPAASIPNSALQTSVMLKTTYDTNADGVVESAVNADTVDGSHAAAFAVASYITSGTLDGDRLPALSATKKGGAPATGTPSGKFLRDDATWVATSGMILPVLGGYISTTTDSWDYHFGCPYDASLDWNPDRHRVYIPRAGTIKVAYIAWYAVVAGSNENISVYVRLNNTTDTLVATVGNTANRKLFSNTGLSIAVVQGDYIEIKMVCPGWATNPTGVNLGGTVYIE